MNETLVAAVLAFFGTLIGTFSGILVNTKLMNYRIEQLELRLKEISDFGEKILILEGDAKLFEEKLKVANHRIDDLEGKVK